jgi:glycosyltransferase involved in cell wall biosynthesis
MKKILIVMQHYPFPPKAGAAIAAFNHMQRLSAGHVVHLICTDGGQSKMKMSDKDVGANQVHVIKAKPVSRVQQILYHAYYVLARKPFPSQACLAWSMRQQISELDKIENFDSILLYGIDTTPYCPPACYKKAIINVEDAQSIKHYRLAKLDVFSPFEKIKLVVYAACTQFYEYLFLHDFKKVHLLSSADADEMRLQGEYDNIGFVPYGVSLHQKDEYCSEQEREKGMIVFSGNMFHKPNVDAAIFFLNDIFPLVLAQYPNAKFWIVGNEPDKRIYAAAARFNTSVSITGGVPDISEYIKKAVVSVCPIRLRIGIMTKVLEALSWGTPVVTTSAGNRGVCGVSEKDLWVEDDPVKFAGRVVSLLKGENWQKFSEEGLKFVSVNFPWERSVEMLLSDMENSGTHGNSSRGL